LIGRALGLIIAPVSTLITMLGEVGLARVLTMVGSRLLGLMGPVGWAISAFLLFKDEIIFALTAVWNGLVETLGPPLQAIFTKLGTLFEKLSGGPIGSGIQSLIDLFWSVKDVIGTVLVGAIMLAGEVIERTLAAIVTVISGVVDVVIGVVDVISALLRGDFAGAWEAAAGIVGDVFDTLVGIIAAFVPEIRAELSLVYWLAKEWLVDKFQAIMGWFSGIVQSGVNYVADAFPNVVAAAKSVYTGVKGWLVDKFGGLMTWIGKIAKWIGDKYAALKKRLGLGESGGDTTPGAPEKPKQEDAPSTPKPKRPVDFAGEPKASGGGGSKGRGGGASADDQRENRQQIKDDLELEAARLRGDIEAERAIRNRLDLAKQIEAYQRTGLSLESATTAAKQDMVLLEAARRDGLSKDLERDEAAHKIDL
ncbi:MAG: phage tail tape measure protein, partial [Sphingomonadales bacterium 39-62-4]